MIFEESDCYLLGMFLAFFYYPLVFKSFLGGVLFLFSVATVLIKHFYFPDEDWRSFMWTYLFNCVLIFVALLLVALIGTPCFKWALDTFYSMY